MSPLAYQRDRGLQVESPAAAPAMVARALEPGRYVVGYSDFQAYEVSGPGVHLLLVLGWTWLVAAALVLRSALVVWLGVDAFRAAWALLAAPTPVVPQPA